MPADLLSRSEISGLNIVFDILKVIWMDAGFRVCEPDRDDEQLRTANAWGEIIVQVTMLGVVLVVIVEFGFVDWVNDLTIVLTGFRS